MISAAEKESVLPNSIITEVLVANPQSAKSDKVLNKLAERAEPPSNNQLSQIHANDTVLGDKQNKEALISGYRSKAAQNVYDMVRLHMNDSSGNKIDSINVVLAYINNPTSYYSKAFFFLIKGDSTNVVNTLLDVESDFEFTQKQKNEHDYFEEYFNLLLMQQSNNKQYTDLDSNQMVTLTDIADNANGKVKAYAQNLLAAITGNHYPEQIIFPSCSNKSEKVEWENVFESDVASNYFKLYPNPANNYISIEYNFDYNFSNALFSVITLEGATVLNFKTNYRQGVHNIDLRDWKQGTYIISLKSNGRMLQSEKFIKF